MYDHSEQFEVSPWWADVPTPQRPALFVTPGGCSQEPPSVKYRAIFLNDEQPALQNWAAEKFTNGTSAALTGTPFNHLFYSQLFELMLRLKANHLWPVSAFGLDDPQNQAVADFYGIVMGTSHQEPMVNAQNIYNFWVAGAMRAKPYENVWTIGMRGDGDEPITGSVPVTLLEKTTAEQKQILMNVLNVTNTTIADVSQMWALYKEVEGYYDEGLNVFDYVTLLWTDDNWGNVRQYPLVSERNRTGGAGLIFDFLQLDYVGIARDYKWITIYEQISIAIDRDASRIWVANVGDLKPYERETEFFITYAWNVSRWNLDNPDTFVSSWAKREFGVSDPDAASVAEIVMNLTRFNARRKHELLNSTTYSLIKYRESENVQAAWNLLQDTSTTIYNKLPAATRPAYFQLIHHAVLASANWEICSFWPVKIICGQVRLDSARTNSRTTSRCFSSMIFDLETQYHSLLDGKWDQRANLGYAYWQQPMTNSMSPISRVQKDKQALPGVMRIFPEGTPAAWQVLILFIYQACPYTPTIGPGIINSNALPWSTILHRGPIPFTFSTAINASWLTVSPSHGSISPGHTEQRVFANVDWSQLDEGLSEATVNFTAVSGSPPTTLLVQAFFVANKTSLPSDFKCFVEGGGAIAFEAEHAARNNSRGGHGLESLTRPRTNTLCEYDFYNFNGGNNTVTTFVSPSGNGNGNDRPLGFALQVDAGEVQSNYFFPLAAPGAEPDAWGGNDGFAANSIVPAANTFSIAPGAHPLKLFMIEPAVVVQKIVLDTGG
ncbi:GH115-C domain-containing protein [Mycena venus]|uniref:GH115-C domain-containing protein n=1 Tax=Mycena venus TaxID=2733690 RepID=A0A8H6Z5T5_9AGAR|nr:GH115-C domain-containing protein [Mycena venus]